MNAKLEQEEGYRPTLVVDTITKKFSTKWRMRKNKNKPSLLNMKKIKVQIEINKYKSNVSEEIKK